MVANISKNTSLAQLFNFHYMCNPGFPALVIDGKVYSYAEVAKKVLQLAHLLKKNNIRRLGIFAARSLEAYVAVLATHWLGIAYVPLNAVFPASYLKNIIEQAQPDGLVADALRLPLLTGFMESFAYQTQIIGPSQIDAMTELTDGPVEPTSTQLAYLIFTSGSTGEPKGVPISYGNLSSFIAVTHQRYHLNATDRVAQFSALTFDVSIFDMCVAWNNGAALYVVPDATLLVPAKFISDNNLTMCVLVPSVISLMHKLTMLTPNYFPALKYSVFTGEALTAQQVELWRVAAPASQIENLYGPTEATIDCLGCVLSPQTNYYHNAAPIGTPFINMFAALINDDDEFLSLNQEGQLIIAGPQVAVGYWQNEELSRQKFKNLSHPMLGMKTWYLTGDYCYQDEAGIFYYLGRIDNQCKILGNRVELEEIEYHIKDLIKNMDAVALVLATAGHDQIIVVCNNPNIKEAALKRELKQRLPAYMVPARIIYKNEFFYNNHAKLDRGLLKKWLIENLDKISGAG
jgi:D-alanine--poly(phosphoribitol) ligase subunit 1